jgi:hypothetical protein
LLLTGGGGFDFGGLPLFSSFFFFILLYPSSFVPCY